MSTQNAVKADLVRPEDKEKDVLNRFTDLCIRKKDRWKYIRSYMETRSVGSRNPEFCRSDVLIEDEKTMEDMLKLYIEKSDSCTKKISRHPEQLKCECLDHILPTCEYHNYLKGVTS